MRDHVLLRGSQSVVLDISDHLESCGSGGIMIARPGQATQITLIAVEREQQSDPRLVQGCK